MEATRTQLVQKEKSQRQLLKHTSASSMRSKGAAPSARGEKSLPSSPSGTRPGMRLGVGAGSRGDLMRDTGMAGAFAPSEIIVDVDHLVWVCLKYWWEQDEEDTVGVVWQTFWSLPLGAKDLMGLCCWCCLCRRH